ESGPLRSWRHEHLFDDAPDGGTVMTDRIEFDLPAPVANAWTTGRIRAELERMFAYRARLVTGDLAFHSRIHLAPRTIAVTGSTGLIGRQVHALLAGGGHRLLRLVRRPARTEDEISWDPDRGVVDVDRLAGCDVVIHLGGHPIGGRFTAENKQKM